MSDLAWKKICCPVDFTEPSEAALRVAADLCRRLDAELVLLNVSGAPRVADELPAAGPVDAELGAWKERAERLGAPAVRVAHAQGRPEVAIVEFARDAHADLVVMGTHGRVDRGHMLTGSVAEAVVRTCECPVLTVHPGWRSVTPG